MTRVALVVCSAAVVACVVACGGGSPIPKRGSDEPGAKKLATAESQAERKQIIEHLRARKVIGTVEKDASSSSVYVMPAFYLLSDEDRQLAMSAVAAWCFQVPPGDRLERNETLYIHDHMTREVKGRLDDHGFRMD